MKDYEAILKLPKMPKSCSECDFCEMYDIDRNIGDYGYMCQRLNVFGLDTTQRHPQCPLQPHVPNEEVEEALKDLEEIKKYGEDINWFEFCWELEHYDKFDFIKQALHTPKISEEVKLYKKLVSAEIKREKYKGYAIMYLDYLGTYKDKHKYYVAKCKELRSKLKSLGGNK